MFHHLKLYWSPHPIGKPLGKEEFNVGEDNQRTKLLLPAGSWISLCESQVTSAVSMIAESKWKAKMEIRTTGA